MRCVAFAVPVFAALALAAAGARAPEIEKPSRTVMGEEPVVADVADLDLDVIAAALLLSLEMTLR
jgi:hypothetical protein